MASCARRATQKLESPQALFLNIDAGRLPEQHDNGVRSFRSVCTCHTESQAKHYAGQKRQAGGRRPAPCSRFVGVSRFEQVISTACDDARVDHP